MDVSKVLAALRQERAQIEQVIANLERLEQSRERRRGRPPALLTGTRKRGRPRGSKNRNSFRTPNMFSTAAERPPRVMAAGQSAPPEGLTGPTELM